MAKIREKNFTAANNEGRTEDKTKFYFVLTVREDLYLREPELKGHGIVRWVGQQVKNVNRRESKVLRALKALIKLCNFYLSDFVLPGAVLYSRCTACQCGLTNDI